MFLLAQVYAHGFLMDVKSIKEIQQQKIQPAVYNYAAISYNIDSLRSPITQGSVCRGISKGQESRKISLVNGQSFTVLQAFSNGAQHVGPCKIEIMERGDLNSAVAIVDGEECARAPDAGGRLAQTNSDKSSPASKQCPGLVPPSLVTDDMCMNTWTFTVRNADKIKCKDCVLRWSWKGTHISESNPELYENCMDVSLDGTSQHQQKEEPKDTKSKSDPPKQETKPTNIPIRKVESNQNSQESTDNQEKCDAMKSSQTSNASSGKHQKCDTKEKAWACISENQFVACFPESPQLPSSAPQSCPATLVCKQGPIFVSCDWPSPQSQ